MVHHNLSFVIILDEEGKEEGARGHMTCQILNFHCTCEAEQGIICCASAFFTFQLTPKIFDKPYDCVMRPCGCFNQYVVDATIPFTYYIYNAWVTNVFRMYISNTERVTLHPHDILEDIVD